MQQRVLHQIVQRVDAFLLELVTREGRPGEEVQRSRRGGIAEVYGQREHAFLAQRVDPAGRAGEQVHIGDERGH